MDNLKEQKQILLNAVHSLGRNEIANLFDKEVVTEEAVEPVLKMVKEEENYVEAKEKSKDMNNIKIGTVYTSDTFYMEHRLLEKMSKQGAMGVEMETLALYTNAIVANKNALALFTVTDKLLRGISVPAEQRQTGLNQMIGLALDIAVELEKERK